jgi:hypothetical protein
MNRKETTVSLAIVGMALLATIMTAITPIQASSGTSDNTDEDSGDEIITTAATVNGDDGDREGSSGSGYGSFQDCLAEIDQSPTEQQVQDCIDSSYGGQDSNEDDPSESADENDARSTDVIQKYDQE